MHHEAERSNFHHRVMDFIFFSCKNADMREESKKYAFDAQAAKRVSFVMQTKNRAHLLGDALERCRTLKGPRDELIVIDGASTDSTKEVVERNKDIVDVFVSEPDINGPHAQNKAMLLARGAFIKYISDDDIFYPDAMNQAVDVLENHPEIDVLLCGGIKVSGGSLWAVYVPSGTSYGKHAEDVFRYSAATAGVGHVMRRSSLAKTGLFPLEYQLADAAYVLQSIARGATVRFCRLLLYKHSINERSRSVKAGRAGIYEWAALAWRYSGASFFLRYAARELVHRWLRLSPNRFFKRAGRFLKRFSSKPHYAPETCVWDGGLSE